LADAADKTNGPAGDGSQPKPHPAGYFEGESMNRRRAFTVAGQAVGGIAGAIIVLPAVGFALAPIFEKPKELWESVGLTTRFTDTTYKPVVFTIVEGIVIPRWFLGPLSDALRAAGHAVAYAVLRAPLELCLARRDQIDARVVEGIWSQFQDLGELEPHAIDVAGATPDAIVRELTDGLDSRFHLSS